MDIDYIILSNTWHYYVSIYYLIKSVITSIKVGDYVDYYESNSVAGTKDKLCSGHITEIYPCDNMSVMIDTHLVIGLDPISYGRPIHFPSETGSWFYSDSSNIDFIVGACEGGSIEATCRYSNKYKRIDKEACYQNEE